MSKTTLEQWRMLSALIKHGGFAQAAEAVYKSQSTVHHAVHKLEDMLGVKLIEVKGRKAFLTETGSVLLKRAHYLLDESAKLEDMATTLKSGLETHLRMAVDEAFPYQRLFCALDHVSQTYSQVQIELYETVLSGADELLAEGQVNISISPYRLSNGISEEILTTSFIAVAHPDHPLFDGDDPIGFEALKSHRQIVVRDSASSIAKDEGWLGSDHRWTVSNMKTSIDMVSRGLGYAWLPESSIEDCINNDQMKALHLKVGGVRSVSFYLNVTDWGNLGVAAHLLCEQILAIEKSQSDL